LGAAAAILQPPNPKSDRLLEKYSIEQRAAQIFDAHIHMASLICGNVSLSLLSS